MRGVPWRLQVWWKRRSYPFLPLDSAKRDLKVSIWEYQNQLLDGIEGLDAAIMKANPKIVWYEDDLLPRLNRPVSGLREFIYTNVPGYLWCDWAWQDVIVHEHMSAIFPVRLDRFPRPVKVRNLHPSRGASDCGVALSSPHLHTG